MDPFKMLKEDHKKVKDLFRQFESTGERAYQKKQELAEKIFRELEVHTSLEEEIFYPAVRESSDKEGKELIAEAYEEHRIVKQLIEELQDLDAKDETYNAKFKVLIENVEHHVQEEEGEPFFAIEFF